MQPETKDVTIIGGGPIGLYAAFYAGMRGASARIIDSLPELGGQLTALYPEKDVYDVGGFPRITAGELARNLIEQGLQFGADVRLEERVLNLEPGPDGYVLATSKARYPSRTVLIAAGKGAFSPRSLECPGYDRFVGRGIAHHVKDPASYSGRRVLIVGGGDSAVDWALHLKELASRVVLIHRRAGFRAHDASMRQLQDAVAVGSVELLTYREVREIRGEECVQAATIFDNRTGDDTTFDVDAVLALIGFKPDIGPLADWGIELEKNTIRVGQDLQTNLPGVFAAGDITAYPGKLELIATGFGEAAIAVNHAVHHIDPTARLNPGHSTNMKVFKDRKESVPA